jgi:Lar family restriction alleviation protein
MAADHSHNGGAAMPTKEQIAEARYAAAGASYMLDDGGGRSHSAVDEGISRLKRALRCLGVETDVRPAKPAPGVPMAVLERLREGIERCEASRSRTAAMRQDDLRAVVAALEGTAAEETRTNDLLPCPFCVTRGHGLSVDRPMQPADGRHLRVRCNECGGSGPHGEGRAEAAEAWNRRTPGA